MKSFQKNEGERKKNYIQYIPLDTYTHKRKKNEKKATIF